MEYNKKRFNKVNDKKLLHKVRKQWVVVSSALLMLLGGGAVVSMNPIHASANTNSSNNSNSNKGSIVKNNLNHALSKQYQQNTNNTNNKINISNLSKNNRNQAINNQANILHQKLLANNIHNSKVESNSNQNTSNQSNNTNNNKPDYVNQVNHAFGKNTNSEIHNNTQKYIHNINNDFKSAQDNKTQSPKLINAQSAQADNKVSNTSPDNILTGTYQGLHYIYNPDNSTLRFVGGTLNWHNSNYSYAEAFLGDQSTTAHPFMKKAQNVKFENGVNIPQLTRGSGSSNVNLQYFIVDDSSLKTLSFGSSLANYKTVKENETLGKAMLESDYNLQSLVIPNGFFGQYDSDNSNALVSDNSLSDIVILNNSGRHYMSTKLSGLGLSGNWNISNLDNVQPGTYSRNGAKNRVGEYDGLDYIYNPQTSTATFVGGKINWSNHKGSNAFINSKKNIGPSDLQKANTIIFNSDADMSTAGAGTASMFESDYNLHKIVLNSNFATQKSQGISRADMFLSDYNLSDVTIPQGFINTNSYTPWGGDGDNFMFGASWMHSPIKSFTITPVNGSVPGGNTTRFDDNAYFNPTTFYNDNNDKISFINSNLLPGHYTKDSKSTTVSFKVHYHDIFSKDDQQIPGTLKDGTLTVQKSGNNYTFNNKLFPKGWLPVDNSGNVINKFTPQKAPVQNINVAPAYFGLTYDYNANTQTVKFISGKLTWNANVGAEGNWGNYDFLGGYTNGYWHNHSGSSSHYAGYSPAPLFLDKTKHIIFGDAVDTSAVDYSSNGQGGNYMYMFANNPYVQTIDLGNSFTTPEVRKYAGISMLGMFESDKDLKEVDLSPSFGGTYDNTKNIFLSDVSLRKLRIRKPVSNPPTSGVYYTALGSSSTGLYSNWYAGNNVAPYQKNGNSTDITDMNQHTGYWYLDRDPQVWSDVTEGGGIDGHGLGASKVEINGHDDTITVKGGTFDPGGLSVGGHHTNNEFAVHLYSQKIQQYLADDVLPNDNKDWKIEFSSDVNVARSDALGRADWLFDGKNEDTNQPDFIGNQVSDINLNNFDLKNAKSAQAFMLNDFNLKHVEVPSDINSGNIKDWYMAFGSDYNISDLDLHNLNTSGTTGTSSNPSATSANTSGAGKDGTRDMFNDDYDLEYLKLGGKFQLPYDKNMSEMFASDYDLSDIEGLSDTLSNTHPQNTFWMFGEDAGLTSLNLPDTFDTSNDVNTAMMFESDAGLTNLHLGKGFNTQNVQDMDDMFASDRSLSSLEFPSDFSTKNALNHESSMLSSDHGLQRITFDGNSTKLSNVTYLPSSWYKVTNTATNPWQTASDATNLIDDIGRKGTWISNPNPKDATKIKFHDIYSDASTDNHGDGLTAPTKIIKGTGTYALANHSIPAGWALVDGNGHILPHYLVNDLRCNLDGGIHTFNVAPVYKGLVYHYDIRDHSLEFTDGTYNVGNDASDFLNVPQFHGNEKANKNMYLKLVKFDSDVNTNRITVANGMFMNDSALESLILPANFAKNITNANSMFMNDNKLEKLNLPSNFGNQINTATDMFASDSSLISLTIPNNFAKNLNNHSNMFRNDMELYRVTGNNTYSDNPLDVNDDLNPNVIPNNIQAGTYVDRNAQKIHIKFHDIYSDIDGFTAPSTNNTFYVTGNSNIINQSDVPGNQALTNSDMPNGWALVDKNGFIVNAESAKINNNTATYNVAPVNYGLTYKYNKKSNSVEFINGTIVTYNNENGTFMGRNTVLNNASYVTFDRGVNDSNLINASVMFPDMKSLKSISFANGFGRNMSNARNMFSSDSSLSSINLPSDFGDQINTANGMFASDSSLTSLTIPNNFAKNLSNHSNMFRNDKELYRVTGNDTYSDNPLDVNGNLNPNVIPNNIQAGTYVSRHMATSQIKFRDIYGDSDGMAIPNGISEKGIPSDTYTINAPSDWTFVNPDGSIANGKNDIINDTNSKSFKYNSGSHTLDIAPIYRGFTYDYNKNNKSVKFVNGTAPNSLLYFVSDANSDIKNAKSITFDNNINTDNVTNMSYMFMNDSHLQSINLGNSFNTEKNSEVSDMSHMFFNDTDLNSLKLPNSFNVSNVRDMESMFSQDRALSSLTLPNSFNPYNVKNMSYMFMNDNKLSSLQLPDSFNTSNVSDMSSMFSNDDLTSLVLPSSFDTSSVTKMPYMFNYYNRNSILQSLTIQSNKSKFNSSANLPTMYKEIGHTGFGNRTPNDFSKGNIGTFVRKSITTKPKVIYVNQNNDVVGSDSDINIDASDNITWPTTAPNGYFIDGGQETSHTIQASDIDSNGNLIKGDFNHDGSHTIYVTGNKAVLNVNYTMKSGYNPRDFSSDDYTINGANSIGDTISDIKIPQDYSLVLSPIYYYNGQLSYSDVVNGNASTYNGYYIDASNPNNKKLDYIFTPSDIGSGNSQNNYQALVTMKNTDLPLIPNKARVDVQYVDTSDNHSIYELNASHYINDQITLPDVSTLNNDYSDNNNASGELNYVYRPSDVAGSSINNSDIMSPYIVYVHRKSNIVPRLDIIYINDDNGNQLNSDIISGNIGDDVEILNNGMSNHSNDIASYVPYGYELTDNNSGKEIVPLGQITNNKPNLIYIHVKGTSQVPIVNDKVNVTDIFTNNNGSKTISDKQVTVSGEIGSDRTINASDYTNRGYNIMYPSKQSVVIGNNGITTPQHIVFNYQAKPADAPVTIYFKDGNKVIGTPITVTKEKDGSDVNSIIGAYSSSGREYANALPQGYQLDSSNNGLITYTRFPHSYNVNVQGIPMSQTFSVYRIRKDLNGSVWTSDKPITITLSGHYGDTFWVSPYKVNGTDIISSLDKTSDNKADDISYHPDSSNFDFKVGFNPNGTLKPFSDISFIYDQDYNPNANTNQIGKIYIHYVDSSSGDDVDVESDAGIAGSSFNIHPYLDDIPESMSNANINYDLVDTTTPTNSISSGQGINQFNNGTQNIYIKVKKQNGNNVIVLDN